MKSSATSAQNPKKKQDPVDKAIQLFGERVTIAGVEDIHKASTKAEGWMFFIALLAAIGGMIFTGEKIASKYLQHNTVFDHYPMAGTQPPFPNVSVCIPLSTNQSLFKQLLIIPDKIRNLIKR